MTVVPRIIKLYIRIKIGIKMYGMYCKNGIKNFPISMIKLFRWMSIDPYFFSELKTVFAEFSRILSWRFLTNDSKGTFQEKKISSRKRNSEINLLGQCKQCGWGFHPSVTRGNRYIVGRYRNKAGNIWKWTCIFMIETCACQTCHGKGGN